MLKEVSSEKEKEPNRRWFSDDYFDLIVWIGQDSAISGFQLCYDKLHRERALTWTRAGGYINERVDDGEDSPTKNRTPILLLDGLFPVQEILTLFVAASAEIDSCIRSFVAEKLGRYKDADRRI